MEENNKKAEEKEQGDEPEGFRLIGRDEINLDRIDIIAAETGRFVERTRKTLLIYEPETHLHVVNLKKLHEYLADLECWPDMAAAGAADGGGSVEWLQKTMDGLKKELDEKRQELRLAERELAARGREIEQLNRLISASGTDTQKNRELAMFMAMRQYSEDHGSWRWLSDLALVQVFRGVDRQVGNDDRLGRINDAHQRLVASDPELVARFRETFAGSPDDSIRTRYCTWRKVAR
jgi:hypothetical protein